MSATRCEIFIAGIPPRLVYIFILIFHYLYIYLIVYSVILKSGLNVPLFCHLQRDFCFLARAYFIIFDDFSIS